MLCAVSIFKVEKGQIVTLLGANGAWKKHNLENYFRSCSRLFRKDRVYGKDITGEVSIISYRWV
jgi:ABC-type branched-subunit amino acid transport system ATPase component